jgi:hypothetical protein
MDLFRDATGRPGPSTWEGGRYPEGKADYPVSGVSWFEAAAYAEFAGKALPVIAQGYKVMPPLLDRFAVAESNLSGTPAPVGQFAGLGPYGTFDLIGNGASGTGMPPTTIFDTRSGARRIRTAPKRCHRSIDRR